MTLRFFSTVGAVLLVVAVHARPAAAQGSALEGLSSATPGARANAMGGTFIAIADDGTASIANPSGLMMLGRPQIYAEVTSAETGLLKNILADPSVAPTTVSINARTSSLSFLSASVPIGNRLTVAATRYQFFKFDESAQETFGSIPASIKGEASGVSYSGSVGVRVTQRLQAGVTVGADRLTSTVSTTVNGQPLSTDTTDETGTSAIFGALFRANDMVQFGVSVTAGSENAQPNRVGGGVSARPIPQLLVSADVVHIGSGLDVTEVHGGGEYSFAMGANRAFVRAGAFGGQTSPNCTACDDNVGGSVGGGFAFSQHLQADVAFVSLGKRFIASVAGRF